MAGPATNVGASTRALLSRSRQRRAANTRVTHPVYHVVASFHPDDIVTRQTMERVAHRLLGNWACRRIRHASSATRDRPHAHFHIVVNRVMERTGETPLVVGFGQHWLAC
jgi:Relaxase/Mobilisation nuclease domain